MDIRIDKKYMILPASKYAAPKRILIYDGDELIFDFVCKIDNLTPDFTAYVDLSLFFGKEVMIKIEPDVPYVPVFSDLMELGDVYSDPLRPKVHFTVKNGWTNDPNGLVYHGGVYHMFYQYNPAGAEWANMHWGHATSKDLLHWEEQDIALFPDSLGTMFSGSAIIDKNNVSKLGKGAMLLYYTAAGGTSSLSAGKKFTQCLAYSTDGGKTFKKYAGNPIVEHIEAANRDPKVVYVEELERFVMLLYLQKNDYAILTSEDLVHFTLLQKIEIQGDAECPDIFYLYCGGVKYWIIMGACDKYIVGRFEDGRFIAKSETKTLTHLKMSYAAQSFSGIKDGCAVRIAWDIINNPSDRFTSQMGIPMEMSLQMHNGELHLCCSPIKEIEMLYSSSEEKESLPLSDDAIFPLGECAADISLSCTLPPDEKLRMLIFGVELICDNDKKELRCKNAKMPLLSEKLELRIIADKSSVEIYSEGGAAFVAVSALSDYNLPYFKLFKNENATLDRVEVHGLKKIFG